jgi:hypothetical protein
MVKFGASGRIKRQHWIVAALLIAMAALALFAMGRPPICTCGTVKLWVGAVNSADNSQHLIDWYSPSHLIHGLLFYWIGALVLRRNPMGERLVGAVAIEACWEVLENSKYIIHRYREATAALGYTGDSIINSMSDISFMIVGFILASRLPVRASVALGVGLELLALWAVRDNLTLNVVMLLHPIDAIRHWQAAGGHAF